MYTFRLTSLGRPSTFFDMKTAARSDDGRARTSEATRSRLIREAATLFNLRGYAGTSVGDILERSKLSKGALYNHFVSKDEIAEESFGYASGLLFDRFHAAMEKVKSPLAQLEAILDIYSNGADKAPSGGCPILNAAIEVDDVDSSLREAVRGAMRRWLELIEVTVRHAIADGELPADVDVKNLASVFVASIEGGVMLSRLYRDPMHRRNAAEHLRAHVRALAKNNAMP
jgi:TetR/AcrR family transcriptional repressor of nem operon